MARASLIRIVERLSFAISVFAGVAAAIAGGVGWPITAVVTGCLAAAAPLIGRYATAKLAAASERAADRRIVEANSRADMAIAHLNSLRVQLSPRTISTQQAAIIKNVLENGPAFELWVAHNRQEAEPAAFHAQIFEVIKASGLSPQWFGGMSNSTMGIELSGPDGEEKDRLMAALQAGGVAFTPIVFADHVRTLPGITLWVGSHPGVSI